MPPGGAFAGPEAAGELCRMQELTGADTVIFCPGAVQTGPFVEEIDFTGRHTTSDEELLAMTQLAHDRGMRVFLEARRQLPGRHMAGAHQLF